MALSGFIRRLVQTDTVFGSEAKKLSGINDGSTRVFDMSVHFNPDSNTIELTNLETPEAWMVPGKYFRINLDGFNFPPPPESPGEPETIRGNTNHFRLFRILNVTNNFNRVQFELDSTAPGADTLIDEIRVGGIVDGRISTIINDPTIARPSETGSTIFNLDVQRSTGIEDGSGVSNKFAGHYHTQIKPVTHELDNGGNILAYISSASFSTRNITALTDDHNVVDTPTLYTYVDATFPVEEFSAATPTTNDIFLTEGTPEAPTALGDPSNATVIRWSYSSSVTTGIRGISRSEISTGNYRILMQVDDPDSEFDNNTIITQSENVDQFILFRILEVVENSTGFGAFFSVEPVLGTGTSLTAGEMIFVSAFNIFSEVSHTVVSSLNAGDTTLLGPLILVDEDGDVVMSEN